jgi:hypothetical protein
MFFGFVGILVYVWILLASWKAPVHFAARTLSAATATSFMLGLVVLATLTACLLFGTYLAGLFLLTALSFLVFVPMRFAHWLWLMKRKITYRCPYDDCGHTGLPIHICECGIAYPDLYPSFYSIYYHTCRHKDKDVKLPTMDFLGRNRLPRLCPNTECKRPLLFTSLGELNATPIAVVGGPSAGKSAFLLQAICQLIGRLDKVSGNRVFIDSPEQRSRIQDGWKGLDEGREPAKTAGDVVQAFGLAMRLRTGESITGGLTGSVPSILPQNHSISDSS